MPPHPHRVQTGNLYPVRATARRGVLHCRASGAAAGHRRGESNLAVRRIAGPDVFLQRHHPESPSASRSPASSPDRAFVTEVATPPRTSMFCAPYSVTPTSIRSGACPSTSTTGPTRRPAICNDPLRQQGCPRVSGEVGRSVPVTEPARDARRRGARSAVSSLATSVARRTMTLQHVLG